MVNEEIITALKNAVNNGEPLQEAIQIMINSGYDPREVNESSQFLGYTPQPYQQPKPIQQPIQQKTEQMQVQQKQNQISQIRQQNQNFQIQQQNQSQKKIPQQTFYPPQTIQPKPLTPLILEPTIKHKKESHAKEIILLIVLIILTGALISSLIFRDAILKFFSA